MAEQSISLKLLVNKTSNTVVFAESGPDFVDVLLSFLTFPIGAIAHLTTKQSSVGCIDKLYESVEHHNEDFFMTKACKSMLLPPRNSSAVQCKRLKINIDCTEDTEFYTCSNTVCRTIDHKLLSTYADCKCLCGSNMNRKVHLNGSKSKVLNSAEDGVFAKGTTFLIRDDLTIDTIYRHAQWIDKLDISD